MPPQLTESITSALSATISGVITDSIGRPLSGVTVALNGQEQATATTGLTGTFSFPISTPGRTASVSVTPTKGGCTFDPSAANLNGISGSRTVNFTGTGASCVGVAAATAVDPGPRGGPPGAGTPRTPQPINPDDPTAQAQAGVACLSTSSNTTPAPGLEGRLRACDHSLPGDRLRVRYGRCRERRSASDRPSTGTAAPCATASLASSEAARA
jgi:hypothetical protein